MSDRQSKRGLGGYLALALVAIVSAPLAQGAALPATLAAAMQGNHVVLLGEVHDHPAGHALRTNWLRQALAAGWRPALVFEQFERARQAQLDSTRAGCGRDADCLIARAGGQGWDWPLYRPLLQLALDYELPLIAAGIGREQAGALRAGGYGALFAPAALARLTPDAAAADLVAGQRQAIADGHCNMLPARALDAMLPMQLARDMAMAEALRQQPGGAVLIAGNGHVRRDLGVPRWLGLAPAAFSVGFVEQAASDAPYDLVAVLPPMQRDDPCVGLRQKAAGN